MRSGLKVSSKVEATLDFLESSSARPFDIPSYFRNRGTEREREREREFSVKRSSSRMHYLSSLSAFPTGKTKRIEGSKQRYVDPLFIQCSCRRSDGADFRERNFRIIVIARTPFERLSYSRLSNTSAYFLS